MTSGGRSFMHVACNLGLLLTAAACFQTREVSVLERRQASGEISRPSDSGAPTAGGGGSFVIPPVAPATVTGGAPTPGEQVRRTRETPSERGVCAKGGYCEELESPQTSSVDLLFVVDNSSSMQQEQAALREQIARLIQFMTASAPNARGEIYPPVRDLHLGVVSTDMGVVGVPNLWPGCTNPGTSAGGDDGLLQHPGNTVPGCKAAYPQFVAFSEGQTDPEQVARDFACIVSLGTDGCGFEQPLESALKALWPKNYIDSDGNVWFPEMNPIKFLAATPEGVYGHGDQPPNAGFLRNDPVTGLSILEIVVVTDEEDCSSKSTTHFTSSLDPNDPLSTQPPNLRCFFNKQNLFDVERYASGLKQLRPGHEDTVLFGAIVGVPLDLVDREARGSVDFSNAAERDAYYDRILNDPRMQERPINEDIPSIANVAPSCTRTDRNGERAEASPPRRIVEVAKGFGARGFVESICQDDFTDAIDSIYGSALASFNSPCLPRALKRRDDGKVNCDMIVELPPAGPYPQNEPTKCTGTLSPVEAPRATTNPGGGVNCKIAQVAVKDGVREDGEGFYYDDTLGTDNTQLCMKNRGTSIRFTDDGSPGYGLRTYIDCAPDAEL
jgi:hypothetical protein